VSAAGRHVALEVLADHLEGLLDPAEAARVEDHVGSCALCAAKVEELRGVTRLLAAAPAPAMPADVQDRVEQALRAELQALAAPADGEPAGAAPEPQAPAGPATTVASLEERRGRRGRIRRALLVAAAAVVVVAGGSAVQNLGGPADEQEASTQAESAGESAVERDAPTPGGAPNVAGTLDQARAEQTLIARVFQTRALLPRRDRADCVAAALDDAAWVGTSYAVTLAQRPGAVAFLGEPAVQGVLVTCEPTPAVQRRQRLPR
jgi:anti-sigma factor RsiW